MSDIVYKTVPEYQPSSAFLTLQDPIYKVSQSKENIRIGKAGLPSYAIVLLPILIVGGIAVAWWLTKKK